MAEETEDIRIKLKSLFKKHNYNKSYNTLSIVTNTVDGELSFYQAIRNVPKFVSITDKSYWKLITSNIGDYIDDEPDVPVEPEIIDNTDYLCFTAEKAGAKLTLIGGYNKSYDGAEIDIEYSTDKKHWNTLTFTDASSQTNMYILVQSNIISFAKKGDKVYFRGNNTNGTNYKASYTVSNYFFNFAGANNTTTDIFSVTGDLQTLVDKTGQDKEHGCFCELFVNNNFHITSAPDLTATTLVSYKYKSLFSDQDLLEEPAYMPNFEENSLTGLERVFEAMYSYCTSLKRPANFNFTYEDIANSLYCFNYTYQGTTFNITDDDGYTLNGFDNVQFPSRYKTDQQWLTSFYFAKLVLYNANGFDVVEISTLKQNIIVVSTLKILEEVNNMNRLYHFYKSDAGNNITLRWGGTSYGWKESTDGGTTWTTIEDSASQTLYVTIPTSNHIYNVITINPNPK